MKVKDFFAMVYASITQQAGTLLVGDDNLLAFTNLALVDLFSYEGKIWTVKWKDGYEIAEPVADGKPYYDVTLPTPIARLAVGYDYSMKSSTNCKILQSSNRADETWERGMFFFRPLSTTLRCARNDGKGYRIDYVQWFNDLTSKEDELPVTSPFLPSLHALVLSYVFPLYAQYGENKEASQYQVAQARMKALAMNDFTQVQHVTSNIR